MYTPVHEQSTCPDTPTPLTQVDTPEGLHSQYAPAPVHEPYDRFQVKWEIIQHVHICMCTFAGSNISQGVHFKYPTSQVRVPSSRSTYPASNHQDIARRERRIPLRHQNLRDNNHALQHICLQLLRARCLQKAALESAGVPRTKNMAIMKPRSTVS